MFNCSLRSRGWHLRFILVILLTLLIAGLVWLPSPTRAAPESSGQAYLAVQFNDHDRLVRTINFSTTISGLDALLQSGLSVETKDYSWGTAVCSIEGVGCPPDDCFCGGSNFWNYEYWNFDSNSWEHHSIGASGYNVYNGNVEGWRWGEWGGKPILPWQQLNSAREALIWLRSQQNADGGFGGSDVYSSSESLLSIASNHEKAGDWVRSPGNQSLAAYMMANAAGYANQSATRVGKVTVGISSSDTCKTHNLLEPLDFYNSATGAFGDDAGALTQAWAILGTRALSESIPTEAINYLQNLQIITTTNTTTIGGWEWDTGWGMDTNTTSLAIQALLSAGLNNTDPSIQYALNYFHAAQNSDGGFPFSLTDPSSSSDADSTAYVLQALYALGEDPLSDAWKKNGVSPLDFLISLQLDDGSYKWQSSYGSNLLATQQAIPALLGRAMPFTTSGSRDCLDTFLPIISR